MAPGGAADKGKFVNRHEVSRRAGVAELVDARGLGPRGENRGGSSPFARTTSLYERMVRFKRSLSGTVGTK